MVADIRHIQLSNMGPVPKWFFDIRLYGQIWHWRGSTWFYGNSQPYVLLDEILSGPLALVYLA